MIRIKDRLTILFMCVALFGALQYAVGQAVGTPYIIPTQDIPFSFLAGGDMTESPGAVEQTSDGGYITISSSSSSATGNVTGSNHGATNFSTDVWVVKYDQYGKIQWQRLYGGDNYEYGYSIKQTSDGGYIFAGTTTTTVTGTGDMMALPANHGGEGDVWIVKLTATGTISWQRILGGTNMDYAQVIHQTSDGGYIVGGRTRSSASGEVTSTRPNTAHDFWVVKLTSTGTLSWQQAYGNPTGGAENDILSGFNPTRDGTGYILSGFSAITLGSDDFFAVKINLTGGVVWTRTYGSSSTDTCYSSAATSDGGTILAGYSTGSANGDVTPTNHGGADMWVIKLNSAGNIQWQRLLGGTGTDIAYSVIQTSDGGYMVAGISNSSASGDVTSTNHGGNDVCVFKLSSTGVTQWHRLFGGDKSDGGALTTPINQNPVRLHQAVDGDYVITSTSASDNNGDVTDAYNGGTARDTYIYDQWIFKFDETGTIVWVPDVGQKN